MPLMSPTLEQMLRAEPADGAYDSLYQAGEGDPFHPGDVRRMAKDGTTPGKRPLHNSRVVVNQSSGDALVMPTLEFAPPRKVRPRG